MAGNERSEDSIGKWLEEAAPTRLPGRVLDATFERTRRTRQETDWRTVLWSPSRPRLLPALGGAAVVVAATALLALNVGLISLPGSTPTPPPAATSSPSLGPFSPPGFMWPQSTLEEVQAAQELADAGDPRYTWQVAPYLVLQIQQHHPYVARKPEGGVVDAEIFARFLEQKLGWEAFRWEEAFAHPDGLDSGEVVYVRCAPGRTNPLYPTDPEGCAPTIDEFRYETVHITVAQLAREDSPGIWVVTGWELVEPVALADPRVVEAEATALLEAFLQARIDGAGAEEQLVDPEIPLLYATSAGAPYERTEVELVDGPAWPDGWMRYVVRLFAENGETTVEQHFSLDRDESDRLRLVYIEEGSGDGAGTTENGKAVPIEYGFLDGVVTFRAAYPLAPSDDGFGDWGLAIHGLLPDDDVPRRILLFMADPRPLGSGCVDAAPPAEALVRSLVADPNFEGSAPVAVTIGGLPALQMDGVRARATSCGIELEPVRSARQGRPRLYLVDLPGGSARVLGIYTSADDDSFETVLEWAAPVIDSIEFHAP